MGPREPIAKIKGPKGKVEGSGRKRGKDGEGGCKRQGVGKENSQGRIRVWRLGGLGPVLGYSLASQKLFIFLLKKNNFDN